MGEARRFRVFVSSPSDVFGERERIERVIERLNGELGSGAELHVIRWEQTYYTADKTFQDQILLPSQTDLVICILWKRLGAELPPQYRRLDGTTPTGTEYEFEEAMQAARAKGTPDVLVYRKTAAVYLDAEHVELEKAQFEALKRFWSRWFQNESGHFTAAYESFETTDQFETLVEDHIRQWLLRNKADVAATATWSIVLKGSPFRGLQPFDEGHADVFFGRRRVVEQIRQHLVKADKRGSPFLLLLGMSGSGKSSLARAGLVPRLTQLGAVPGVDQWRRCVFRPSEGHGDSFLAFARGLYRADVLPELAAGDCPSPPDFATLLRSSPEAAARTVRMALGRAGKAVAIREGFDRTLVSRLLVVVDQFEDALGGSGDERDAFARALAALATGGQTWIIATLRSDFYASFQASSPLVALRERGATFDLLAPSRAEIAEIVAEPAGAAGLRFEARSNGIELDEELIAAADRPGSLPLLQLALDELFAARDPATNILPVAAYDAFGGLAGVVERRAEEALGKLDVEAVAALPWVLSSLVTVSDEGIVTSRPAARAEAGAAPGAGRLIDAFVAARLIVADDDHGIVRIRPTHDALIAIWPRAQQLIAADRDALRTRDRVEAVALRWRTETRRVDYLLPPGKPLAEAVDLVAGRADQLSPLALEFVQASQNAEAERQAAAKAVSERVLRLQTEAAQERAVAALRLVRRTRMASAVVTLLLVLVGGVAAFAWRERGDAERRAIAAERNFAAAMSLAGQMSKAAALEGRNDHAGAVEALRKGLGTVQAISDHDPDAGGWYVLQRANAQLHRSIGQIQVRSGATANGMAEMTTGLDLFKRAAYGADSADRQDDVVTTEQVIASALFLQGDKPGAVDHLRASVVAAKAAADGGPNKPDYADTLATSYRLLGDMLGQTDDQRGSLDAYEQARAIAERNRASETDGLNWPLQLAQAQVGAGFALRKLNDQQESFARFQAALDAFRQVLVKTPGDADVVHATDTAEQSVALGLEMKGDLPGALDHAMAALARGDAMLAKNPNAPTWTMDVAISQTYVAAIIKQLGQPDRAQEHFDKARLLMGQIKVPSRQ